MTIDDLRAFIHERTCQAGTDDPETLMTRQILTALQDAASDAGLSGIG